MKYSILFRGMGSVIGSMTRERITDKKIRRDIKKMYKQIVLRAKDIGSGNRLLSSYALAAYFIAMNRNDGLTPEENCKILENGMAASKLFKAFMGDADGYFSEKNMESRRQWSKQTHEKKYENDWVVDVIEQTDSFRFGFDYLECGVCKLCRDEGCPELAKYLCRLDFKIVEIIGIHLDRTTTLADGGEKCDFRFS